jgi:hypothetical protein
MYHDHIFGKNAKVEIWALFCNLPLGKGKHELVARNKIHLTSVKSTFAL